VQFSIRMNIKAILQFPYSSDIEGFLESEYCIVLESIFDKMFLCMIFFLLLM